LIRVTECRLRIARLGVVKQPIEIIPMARIWVIPLQCRGSSKAHVERGILQLADRLPFWGAQASDSPGVTADLAKRLAKAMALTGNYLGETPIFGWRIACHLVDQPQLPGATFDIAVEADSW
jgi:hypothetical protein